MGSETMVGRSGHAKSYVPRSGNDALDEIAESLSDIRDSFQAFERLANLLSRKLEEELLEKEALKKQEEEKRKSKERETLQRDFTDKVSEKREARALFHEKERVTVSRYRE